MRRLDKYVVGKSASVRNPNSPLPSPRTRAGTPQPKWAVPRETAALPLHAPSGQLLCGVSAYAFQGTNAHAIIQRPPEAPAGGSAAGAAGLPNTSRPTVALWQKEAHWVGPPVHALLHAGRPLAGGSRKASLALDCQLSATPRLAYFWDHRVGGRVLFPGAGFFELATEAAKASAGKAGATASLAAATIPAPLQLPDSQQLAKAAPVVARVSIRLASGALAVASSPAAFKQQHLTGTVAVVASTGVPAAEPAGGSGSGSAPQLASRLLAGLLARHAAPAASPAAAQAAVDNRGCDGSSQFHPASLDSCLQLAAAGAGSALKVPATLGCLHVPDRLTAPLLTAASRQQGAATAPTEPSTVDYWMADAAGGCGLGARASSLQLKPLGPLPAAAAARPAVAVAPKAAPLAAAEELLYEVAWPATEPAAAAAASHAAAAVAAVLQLAPRAGLATTAGAIAALQAAQLETLGGAQLSTRGALSALQAPAAGAAGRAAEGGLPGLMRTLALEYQGQRFGAVDGDSLAASAASANAQLQLLPAGGAPEADGYGAARRGGVHQRAALLPAKARSSTPAFHLMPLPRGALSSLRAQPVDAASVAPGQVLLAVKAVGVNFRWGS